MASSTIDSELNGLVDQHVHGVVPSELDRASFELLISESGEAAPGGTTHFDSPLGLAIRKWCAPIVGLEPHATPEEYLEARTRLGAQANVRFMGAAGLSALLVETGLRQDELLSPKEMGEAAAAKAYEVVRVEKVAEETAARSSGPSEFAAHFKDSLALAAEEAVGLKTIAAYRTGFDLNPEPPSRAELGDALDGWFRIGAGSRLQDAVLERYVLGAAIELAAERHLVVQAHAGFGDRDLDLHKADPVVFTPFVRRFEEAKVPLVFLHCYPYHREAGYLAEVFPHVYFDVGCIINYSGPSGRRILAEAFELAPFTKMLYSSDAFGLAELVYLGAVLFRRHLEAVLSSFIESDYVTESDARRIGRLVSSENAESLYRLEGKEKR